MKNFWQIEWLFNLSKELVWQKNGCAMLALSKNSITMQRVIGCVFAVLLSIASWHNPLQAQGVELKSNLDIKIHKTGNVLRTISNGPIRGGPMLSYQGLLCEYPKQSKMEHISRLFSRFEIGSLAPPGDTLEFLYWSGGSFWPSSSERWDTIWSVNDNALMDIPYWPSYAGISDEDFICRYNNQRTLRAIHYRGRDTVTINHAPLYIDVVEQSFAWAFAPLNEVIVYAYRVTPRKVNLGSTYLVLHFYGGIGKSTEEGWYGDKQRWSDDHSTYFKQRHLAIVEDGPFGFEGQARSCIGYRLFPPRSVPPAMLRWTFTDNSGIIDPVAETGARTEEGFLIGSERSYTTYMYNLVSSGTVSTTPNNNGSGFISVGPFDIAVGDTLVFWTAEILGTDTNDIVRKSEILDRLYLQDFHTPIPPPPPPMRVETQSKRITLHWDPLADGKNPETYQDPYRGDRIAIPFEGYRIYRSTRNIRGPWTLLAEYDISDNGFAYDIGLQHSYTDVGLLDGFEYYYAITAFSKRDTVFGFPSRESNISLTARAITPGTPPPKNVGQVAVVPNPYRGDIPYHQYNPPWERPTGKWTTWFENDRRIQFINLPLQCEIKIYTLSGDHVITLTHDDPTRGVHDWNLTSYVGQAVSSGIYLFSVQDKNTGEVQLGKFVIIK